MALSELPALLRDDPAFTELAGGSARVVAVSEAPRAFFLAGLARLTGPGPLVVGGPTTAEGERPGPGPPGFPSGAGGRAGAPGPDAVFPASEAPPFGNELPAT